MFRTHALLIAAAVSALLLSCAQPETETAPAADEPAAVETGPDATVVDPGHYTIVHENDKVRVLRIAYGAGEESTMHYHPDTVAVFLTDHLVQMTKADGSTAEVAAKAGEVLFIPAEQHLPKNISGEAWELVLVEPK
jgi:quercetin dioxygenase-like cupin family protein